MQTLSQEQLLEFENAGEGGLDVWPEIGSRAFLRTTAAAAVTGSADPWIEVQEDRYRYMVSQADGSLVQLVIGEYLACRVVWH
jgi:hypothetical protein